MSMECLSVSSLFLLTVCTRPIDLGIWLDSSGSLSRDDYQRSKDFVTDLLGRFDISQDGTHVSVGTFSNRIEYFPLDRTYDANRITTAVQRLPRFDSWTFTDLALEAWGKQIFTAQGGVRPVEQGALDPYSIQVLPPSYLALL